MTDAELLNFNAQGFIPGPRETENQFVSRISATRAVFAEKDAIPRAHWEWVRQHLEKLYDFKPESLLAFYSNKNLTIWQGAACWIGEDGVPQLQLREGFRKGSYLGLYSREETLAHESTHAARAAFDEPENEEFFAFSCSEKNWRRVLGPIIKRPWEIWILIGTLILGIFWEPAIVASLVWISLGLFRLFLQHIRRRRASLQLMKKFQKKILARAVMLRLTDLEIRQLGKGKGLQSDDSLRWRLLRIAYFSKIPTTST